MQGASAKYTNLFVCLFENGDRNKVRPLSLVVCSKTRGSKVYIRSSSC